MKFINTISCDLINAEEILTISYEEFYEDHYSYIHLKNGDKHEVYFCHDSFCLEEDCEYWFERTCHTAMNMIICKEIIKMEDGEILDIFNMEDQLWNSFIFWAKYNKDQLVTRKKEK